MHTVNPLGATSRLAVRYLVERATTHDHYPVTYWPSSKVGLLPTVLDRLTPDWNLGYRASLLGIILDQIPRGRKTTKYKRLVEAHPYPLCQEPNFLEHILCCEHLQETREEIQETAFFSYLFPGSFSRASSKIMSRKV
jgi:hypothetical protein